MPIYAYKAFNTESIAVTGDIDADTERDARLQLRERRLMLTHISLKVQKKRVRHFSPQNRVTFTIQLSQILNAGIPLYDGLRSIEEQYRGDKQHYIILALCEQIKSGASLSNSMALFPGSFDQIYISLVAAGESVGQLGEALDQLSSLLFAQMAFRKQVVTAMIYPGMVLSFAFLAIFSLLTFAVPAMKMVFQGQKVNAFTQLVLSLSDHLNLFAPTYVVIFLCALCGIYFFMRSKKGQLCYDHLTITTPVIKQMKARASLARFTRMMASLLRGGMTVIEALQKAKKTIKNHCIEEALSGVEMRIIEGSTLSSELKTLSWIPSLVVQMLSVGEDTGKLTEMFEKIADIYESEFEKSLSRFTALLTPAILVVTGILVAGVMLAVLLPLTDVNAFLAD